MSWLMQANLKLFMDYVGSADVSKVAKLLHKGMDPNFQIKETGGWWSL